MKNVGRSGIEGRHSKESVFHRPSEPDEDVEALRFLGDGFRKSSEVLVKWVMKNATSAAALAGLVATQRSSSPC
jgi:hypothetical protein